MHEPGDLRVRCPSPVELVTVFTHYLSEYREEVPMDQYINNFNACECDLFVDSSDLVIGYILFFLNQETHEVTISVLSLSQEWANAGFIRMLDYLEEALLSDSERMRYRHLKMFVAESDLTQQIILRDRGWKGRSHGEDKYLFTRTISLPVPDHQET